MVTLGGAGDLQEVQVEHGDPHRGNGAAPCFFFLLFLFSSSGTLSGVDLQSCFSSFFFPVVPFLGLVCSFVTVPFLGLVCSFAVPLLFPDGTLSGVGLQFCCFFFFIFSDGTLFGGGSQCCCSSFFPMVPFLGLVCSCVVPLFSSDGTVSGGWFAVCCCCFFFVFLFVFFKKTTFLGVGLQFCCSSFFPMVPFLGLACSFAVPPFFFRWYPFWSWFEVLLFLFFFSDGTLSGVGLQFCCSSFFFLMVPFLGLACSFAVSFFYFFPMVPFLGLVRNVVAPPFFRWYPFWAWFAVVLFLFFLPMVPFLGLVCSFVVPLFFLWYRFWGWFAVLCFLFFFFRWYPFWGWFAVLLFLFSFFFSVVTLCEVCLQFCLFLSFSRWYPFWGWFAVLFFLFVFPMVPFLGLVCRFVFPLCFSGGTLSGVGLQICFSSWFFRRFPFWGWFTGQPKASLVFHTNATVPAVFGSRGAEPCLFPCRLLEGVRQPPQVHQRSSSWGSLKGRFRTQTEG